MIFIDESIQQDLDYICVGFAHCQVPPDDLIGAALLGAGLVPGSDEYKSGYRMVGAEPLHQLRDKIGSIVLSECQLGVYIAPLSERPLLLSSVIETADLITRKNKLSAPQQVFIDEGISGRDRRSDKSMLEVVPNCDSREILGVQLADYVAYHLSYLLKCTIAGTSKQVPVKTRGHPLEDKSVDLDWLVRTDFRRRLFSEPKNVEGIEGDEWFFSTVGYGAFYSSNLSQPVLSAARQTFDSMYFGCVW